MPTIIRVASSASELNDVLQVRFKVLEQSGRTASHSVFVTKRIIDYFDIFPNTINIVAYENGNIVGALRAVEYIGDVALLNHAFDYSEAVQNVKGKSFLLDMIVIVREFSNHLVFQKQLFSTALGILAHKGATHAFTNCPVILEDLCKELGFSKISEPLESQSLKLKITPMVIEVPKFYRKSIEGIADQEIIRFQEVFYKTIFEPGEILVVEGERGSTAYLIEDGEVEVVLNKGDEFIHISTISRGYLLGEVAMITNETRTASLIAKSTTSCIAFDRNDFMKYMYTNPQRSLDVFKIFSKRLNESNKKLAEAKQMAVGK